MKKETAMDKITTAMAEHICDKLCRFPREITDQEQLEDICAGCEMSRYVCNILNEYNQLNDFEKTQCADLLAKLNAEMEKHRWILVEERLPEDGTYLCTLDGELCGLDEPFTGMCGIEGGRWDEDDCVIAWMPLPEPYQPPVLAEAGETAGSYTDNGALAPAT